MGSNAPPLSGGFVSSGRLTEILESCVTATISVGTTLITLIVAWFTLLISLSCVGLFIGSVRLLCFAGLLWSITGLAAVLYIDIFSSLTDLPFRFLGWFLPEADEGERSALKNLLIGLSNLARWLRQKLKDFLHTAIGAAAAWTSFWTFAHLHLARNADAFQQRNPSWWWAACVLILPVVGLIDDIRRQDMANLRAGKRTAFISTLEFSRCILLLFCGLWGDLAFKAADDILALPSQDHIASIPTVIPLIFKKQHQDSAFVLYQQMGFYVYVSLFVALPLLVLCSGIVESIKRHFRKKLLVEPRQIDIRAAGLTSFCLVGLSLSVASRTGAVDRVAGPPWYLNERVDQQGKACLEAAVDVRADDACLETWESGWRTELTNLNAEARPLMSRSMAARLKQNMRNWEKTIIQPLSASIDKEVERGLRLNARFKRGAAIRERALTARKSLAEYQRSRERRQR